MHDACSRCRIGIPGCRRSVPLIRRVSFVRDEFFMVLDRSYTMYAWYWKGAEYYISKHFTCIPTGFSTTPAIICIVALPCDGPRSQETHPHVNEVKKINQSIHMQQYHGHQTLKCCGCSHTGTTYYIRTIKPRI